MIEIEKEKKVQLNQDEKPTIDSFFKNDESIEEKIRKAEETAEELKQSRIALMNILEDVEEAKNRAEEERNRTLTIISSLADGLIVFDKEEKIFLANPKVGEFFRIDPFSLTGKKISEIVSIKGIAPLAKILNNKIKKVSKKELPLENNLTLEVSIIAMEEKEGKKGKIVILHDITREKLIEKTKTEFVSLAAHQLRTPVSATKWTLRMLLDGDLGKITKEQRGFIEKTYESNERMISLINDLLNITRIEEGRYLFEIKEGDIEKIALSMIEEYKEEAAKKKISLKLNKTKKKLPKIKMDLEKIRLVIQNFIENAIKYTPIEGKVESFLEYHEKEKEIVFSAKDSGVGIPEDQQKSIFKKFFRGVNVVKMNTEGTGLGLFISRNIIEAHGGKVWFESKEDKGTTFYFSLPVRSNGNGS
jgi:PAS domain S-box-containing protein